MEIVRETSISSAAPARSRDTVAPDGAHIKRRSWLDGFRRITSSGAYIPEIDGLRFIAVMLILVYHVLVFVCIAQGLPVGRIDSLTRGVEMFFVLSGFVLALPFAAHFLRGERRVRIGAYLLRRITRLEPPYLVCLAIYTIIKLIQVPEADSLILRNALLGAVYLHDAVLGRPGMIVSVAWSLEVEVQFYLLMPLLAYVFVLRPTWLRRSILAAIALFIPLVQPIWLPAILMHNDGHLLNFIQYFFAGMLLADIWVLEWNNAPAPLLSSWVGWGDFAWLFIVIFECLLPRENGFVDRMTLAPVIFIAYLGMFRSAWIRRLMRVRVVSVIGGMCYSIYLMHNLVISAIGGRFVPMLPMGFAPAAIVSSMVLLPAAIGVSGVYFRLIEKPCMRPDWPRRMYRWFVSRLFIEDTAVDR